MRKSASLLLAPALLLMVGCDIEDFGSSDRFTADFHYNQPLKSGGRITVENFNGSVEIAGSDQENVDVSGVKYAGSQDLLDRLKIEVTKSGDVVTIRTVRPSERHGSMGAKYVIRVPRKVELDRISSSNGSIHINDIEGAARLRTSNGGVYANNLKGSLDVSTSNGTVEVEGVDGSAVLKSSNGRVRAEEVTGQLEADTSNGNITVHLAKAESGHPIRLDTSNGSIDLTVDQPGRNDVIASTSNAGITVHLAPSIGAQVKAHTSNGSISSDFDVKVQGEISKHHLEGTIGSGGPMLELSTSNGSIHLIKL